MKNNEYLLKQVCFIIINILLMIGYTSSSVVIANISGFLITVIACLLTSAVLLLIIAFAIMSDSEENPLRQDTENLFKTPHQKILSVIFILATAGFGFMFYASLLTVLFLLTCFLDHDKIVAYNEANKKTKSNEK